jgi:hypothetical protein
MRDDDESPDGSGGAPLAEGLGEIIGSGGSSSAGDPLGDGASPGEGTFGDGEPVGPEADVDGGIDDTGQVDEVDPGAGDDADITAAADGILAESSSPLEGIGYILDELHSALFGEDEAAAADEAVDAALSEDPVGLETDTDLDLDLSGDGVVDPDDLHEAGSPFDFGVDADGG